MEAPPPARMALSGGSAWTDKLRPSAPGRRPRRARVRVLQPPAMAAAISGDFASRYGGPGAVHLMRYFISNGQAVDLVAVCRPREARKIYQI